MLHDMQLMQHRGTCNISRNPFDSQMGPETDNDGDSDNYI